MSPDTVDLPLFIITFRTASIASETSDTSPLAHKRTTVNPTATLRTAILAIGPISFVRTPLDFCSNASAIRSMTSSGLDSINL